MGQSVTVQQFDLFGDPIEDNALDLVPLAPKPADENVTRIGPPSYGRRLTERLRNLADAGINPLTGTRGPDDQTCGDCIHRQLVGGHSKAYPKCDLGPRTAGPKTDVRKYWPACHRFEPTE